MKNLDLENFGVQKLEIREMKEINGGIWPSIFRLAAAAYKAMTLTQGHSSEIHGENLQDNTRVSH